jgi:spore coat polysaccharide biosynthesis protein SpsF
MGNGYPDGLGTELLSRTLLERIARVASLPKHREHVNEFIWDNPEQFNIVPISAPIEIAMPSVKLDIDTEEDMRRMRLLCSTLDVRSSVAEIREAYQGAFS